MPYKTKCLSETESVDVWMRATLHDPDWKALLPEGMFKLVKIYSEAKNGLVNITAGCILGVVSALGGVKCFIRVSEGFDIPGNIYLIGVAPPGFGKSPTFKPVVEEAIHTVEKHNQKNLMVSDFTKSGLMRFMQKNGNRAFLTADEFGGIMERFLSSRLDDFVAFRQILTTCWSNASYTKAFSSAYKINVGSTYLTIFGLVQPEVWANIWANICSVSDGLADRFLMINSPHKDPPLSADDLEGLPPNIVSHFEKKLDAVYSYVWKHNGSATTDQVYTLDDEASTFIDAMMQTQKQEREAVYDEIRKRALGEECDATTSVAQMATTKFCSKDIAHACKLALLLKMLDNAWNKLGDEDARIKVLSLDDLKKGFDLLDCLKRQTKEYVECVLEYQSEEDRGFSRAKKKKCVTIAEINRRILLYPGKFASSRLLHRSFRDVDGKTWRLAIKNLSMERDEEGFVGSAVEVGNNVIAFYKAPPDDVLDATFEKHEINREEYAEKYGVDISEKAPVATDIADWATFYAKMCEKAPDWQRSDDGF